MSHELNMEQVRDEFLQNLRNLCEFWSDQVHDRTEKEKLYGLAHSILVMIDGNSLCSPPFILAPDYSEEDKKFCIEEGYDYYSVNRDSNVKCNIAGELHYMLFETENEEATKE